MKGMQKIGFINVVPARGGVLRLDDGKGSSFYLLEGTGAAVLVDTGMGSEPLRPVIEQLKNKPVTVLITHGHPDHMCQVYACWAWADTQPAQWFFMSLHITYCLQVMRSAPVLASGCI